VEAVLLGLICLIGEEGEDWLYLERPGWYWEIYLWLKRN